MLKLKNINDSLNKAFVFAPLGFRIFLNFLIQIPLVTYYLNVRDFGLIASIQTFVLLILAPFQLKFDWILQKIFSKKKQLKKYFFNLILADFFLKNFITILFLFGYLLLDKTFFSFKIEKIFIDLIILSFIHSVTLGTSEICSFYVSLNKKFNNFFYFDAGRTLLNLIFLFIFFNLNLEIYSYFLSLVFSGIVINLIQIFILRSELQYKIEYNIIISHIKNLKYSSTYLTITSLTDFVERYILLFFSGLNSLGIFYHSKQYFSLFVSIIKYYNKFCISNLSDYFKTKNKKNINFFLLDFKNLLFLYFFVSLIISLLIKDFLFFFTHQKFSEAYIIITLLFNTVIYLMINYIYQIYLNQINKINEFVKYSNISLILFIIISGPLTYFFNYYGMVIAIILRFCLTSEFLMFRYKDFPIVLKKYLKLIKYFFFLANICSLTILQINFSNIYKISLSIIIFLFILKYFFLFFRVEIISSYYNKNKIKDVQKN